MSNRERQRTDEINERAIRLYEYIMIYYAQHDYVPTIREMQFVLGMSSTSIADYTLNVLVAWKWVERVGSGARNIRLLRTTERGYKPAQLRKMMGLEAVPLVSQFKEGVYEPVRRPTQKRVRKPKPESADTKAVTRSRNRPFGG